MPIKTTPASTADISVKWQELVSSGKYRLGSKAAGGYVDNATGQWYSGERGPEKAFNRASKWDALINAGKFRRGSAKAGGYVDSATGKWYAPNSKPPGAEDAEEEQV